VTLSDIAKYPVTLSVAQPATAELLFDEYFTVQWTFDMLICTCEMLAVV